MKKENVILSETLYISSVSLLLSLILQLIIYFLGFWSESILFCNAIGLLCSVLNFFLLGITLQCALCVKREKARKIISLSQIGRTLLILAVVLAGGLTGGLNVIFVLIPLLFPRIAIALRPLFKNNREK